MILPTCKKILEEHRDGKKPKSKPLDLTQVPLVSNGRAKAPEKQSTYLSPRREEDALIDALAEQGAQEHCHLRVGDVPG